MLRQLTSDRQRERRIVFLAAAAYLAVFAARFADPNPENALGLLYVFPVALLAATFGPRVGAGAGAFAFLLNIAWALITNAGLGPIGYLTRAAVMVFVGIAIGRIVMAREEVEHRSARWFDMANSMLCEASLSGYFTKVNGAWTDVLGFTREELLSRPFADFVHPDDIERTRQATAGLAEGPADLVRFENRYGAKDGSWHWLSWTARSDGERIYGVASDITERKRLESEREALLARVEAMARTDALTGLANRRAWDDELRRELSRVRRSGEPVSVMMLDLDNFKELNDRHGHQAGDDFLRDAAIAWRMVLRESDFIARYGGDEFGVLLPRTPSGKGLETLIERLHDAMPNGHSCSVGAATWDGEETAEALVARADAALYEAKRGRSGRVRSAA